MPRSKPNDAAVERLVRKHSQRVSKIWRQIPKLCTTQIQRLEAQELRAIITEARQSAARECADLLDSWPSGHWRPDNHAAAGARVARSAGARAIRERFNLEATDATV